MIVHVTVLMFASLFFLASETHASPLNTLIAVRSPKYDQSVMDQIRGDAVLNGRMRLVQGVLLGKGCLVSAGALNPIIKGRAPNP